MAEDSDPPRKQYQLKPREFERVNEPRSEPAPDPIPPPPEPSVPNTSAITVHDLNRQATGTGPLLSTGPQRRTETEIHSILRENLAREESAGLLKVEYRERKSRRRRDYVLLMTVTNGTLVPMAVYHLRTGNAVGFVYCVAGIGFACAALTWVMWFVMDDY